LFVFRQGCGRFFLFLRILRTGFKRKLSDFICTQRYAEARELLETASQTDAEAMLQLHVVYKLGVLGFQQDMKKAMDYEQRALALGHPWVLARTKEMRFDPSVLEDPYGHWAMLMEEPHGMPPVELLHEAYKREPLPWYLYQMALYYTRDFKPVADLGYPPACLAYAKELPNGPLKRSYLLKAARFGDEVAVRLFCFLCWQVSAFEADLPIAARLATQTNDIVYMFSHRQWSTKFRVALLYPKGHPKALVSPFEIQELYVWGRGLSIKKPNMLGTDMALVIAFYENVRNKVREACIACFGAFRGLPLCRNLKRMLVQFVWASRMEQTEKWNVPIPLLGQSHGADGKVECSDPPFKKLLYVKKSALK
jgi:hypothetical protein